MGKFLYLTLRMANSHNDIKARHLILANVLQSLMCLKMQNNSVGEIVEL